MIGPDSLVGFHCSVLQQIYLILFPQQSAYANKIFLVVALTVSVHCDNYLTYSGSIHSLHIWQMTLFFDVHLVVLPLNVIPCFTFN